MSVKKVMKRNGRLEDFDVNKVNRVVNWATEGIKNVNAADVIMNAELSIQDGTKASDITTILIESAKALFNEEQPNYQYVAGRLLNLDLRKRVWDSTNPPRFYEFVKKNVKLGWYDKDLLKMYSQEEYDELDSYIKHDRDLNFTYAGIKQMCDKYLVQNRSTKEIMETPQFAYMLIAMVGFQRYDKNTRLKFVKEMYDIFSLHKWNLPTPQMAGIRTPMRSYASCCLVEADDTLKSIFSSNTAIGYATARRYGIGLNVGAIRADRAPIGAGAVLHTGIVPYVKMFQYTTKSCHQNGVRGGGGTVFFPWWTYEVENLVMLKDPGGIEDQRARSLDYAILLDKTFLAKAKAKEDIYLFSTHDARDLYELQGMEGFEEAYEAACKDPKRMKHKINAYELMELINKVRVETGRLYVMFSDVYNQHTSWSEQVRQLNLCMEVGTPTKPLQSEFDTEAEIGICTLAAVNMHKIKSEADHERVCSLGVRFLDEILDLQDYFLPAAENFAINRRSLAVGLNGLAGWLAKKGIYFTGPEAVEAIHDFAERQQYYLLKASNELAKEKGTAPKYHLTKYAQGLLPIDTYKKEIDGIVPTNLKMDWESLRQSIAKYGLRHSTLSAQMPCESSSVITNSTNGVEPPKEFISFKKSKAGSVIMMVPGYTKYKKYYTLAYDINDNKGIINNLAAITKFLDMSISTNFYYDYNKYENRMLPEIEVLKDLYYAYRMGIPALYYCNTETENEMGYAVKEILNTEPEEVVEDDDPCASGACTI